MTENQPEKTEEQKLADLNRLQIKMGRQLNSYCVEAEWPDFSKLEKKSNFILRSDGLYAAKNSPAGLFIAKIMEMPSGRVLPGFPKEQNSNSFWLRYGKIPGKNLEEAIEFFKHVCNTNENEVYIQIFFDPKKQVYWNHVPFQRVSKASVKYERNEQIEAEHVLVAEIHSHNTMSAQFSSIDDTDEKSDRIFGVIGRLDKMKPDITLSYVCYGKRVHVPVESVFEAHESVPRFPAEWVNRVIFENAYGVGSSGYSGGWPRKETTPDYHGRSHGGYEWPESEPTSRSLSESSDGEEWGPYGWRTRRTGDFTSGGNGATHLPSSTQGTKTPQQIREEVAQASKVAFKTTVDEALKSRNFLNDALDVEALNEEIKAGAAEEAAKSPILLPASTEKKKLVILRPNTELKIVKADAGSEVPASRAFFRGSERSKAVADGEDVRVDDSMAVWLREEELKTLGLALAEAVQTVIKKLDGQKTSEAWMNKDAKEALFQDLMAFCEEEDVDTMIKVMIDMNHTDKMLKRLLPELKRIEGELESDLADQTIAG